MKTKRSLLLLAICLCVSLVAPPAALSEPAPQGVRIVKVVADYCGCFALDERGKVYAWGSDYMQWGVLNVPKDLPPIQDIGMGTNFAVALDTDGKLHSWGAAEHGETNFQKDLPRFVSISVNHYQTTALTADGQVFAWGDSNQGGQEGIFQSLGVVQKISTGTYVTSTLDINGRIRVWGVAKILPSEQAVRAVDIASNAYSAAYLGDDGKIYGDVTQDSPGSLFRTRPKIKSIAKIFGGDTLLGAIDQDGKAYLWGEYEWNNELQPLWNVPTNLPPITAMSIDNQRVACLGEDGKVYQWVSQPTGIADSLPIPDEINGFLWNPPVIKPYKYPSRKESSYVNTEKQFIAAINSGTRSITCTKSFDLTQDINPKDLILTIRPGVTLRIRCPNFKGGDFIKNQGTLEIYGRISFYDQLPADIGKIVAKNDGDINYCTESPKLDEIQRILGDDSIFTSFSCIGAEGSILLIDKDYTLPRGRMLWVNQNTTLKVAKGVTFTVDGTLEMYTTPIVEGTLVQPK